MSYESTLEFNFSKNVEIKNLKKLNSEIEKLDGGMSTTIIVKTISGYELEIDSYCGSFSDDKKFAEILSKYIVEGKAMLSFVGEQGDKWGYRITPKKVAELSFIAVPTHLLKKVNDYIEYIELLENAK